MKLKATLDTLDSVDEALKAAYTERDGKFYLNVEGLQEHPDAQAVKNALDKTRQEKKSAETKLAEIQDRYAFLPEDFTAEEYNRMVDNGGGDVDKRLADQRERLTKQYDTKLAEREAKLDAANKRADRLHSDAALNSAISESGIAKPFVAAVRAMFKDRVKVDYEGEDAIVTIDSLPVSEKLKAWAQTDDGKHYVAAPTNGGGGANGGAGASKDANNPWAKETMNFTKQAEMERSDPARAQQFKAQAGVK